MLLLKGSGLRATVVTMKWHIWSQCCLNSVTIMITRTHSVTLSRSLCSELDTLVTYYVHCIVFVFPFFGKYYKRRTELLLLTKFHISSKDLKLASYCLTYLQEGYGLWNISTVCTDLYYEDFSTRPCLWHSRESRRDKIFLL